MTYAPVYTTEADVRLVSDISTNAISSADGVELMKKGENRVDSLIQKDNIATSGWGGVIPDLVVDCATFFCTAEWLRKLRTKFGGESSEIKVIIEEWEARAKTAWQEYLDECNLTKGKKVLLTLAPHIGEFDEETWREQD